MEFSIVQEADKPTIKKEFDFKNTWETVKKTCPSREGHLSIYRQIDETDLLELLANAWFNEIPGNLIPGQKYPIIKSIKIEKS
jgi:hypothetical protein